jgi:hypothetical protein
LWFIAKGLPSHDFLAYSRHSLLNVGGGQYRHCGEEKDHFIAVPTATAQERPTREASMTITARAPSAERERDPDGCTTAAWYGEFMDASDAIERISQLLDSDMTQTSNTSMRIPTALREAAALAAKELKAAPSATALTTMALRSALEAAVMRAALDEHYAHHPEARPDLADIAIASAELDGNPLATNPDRIRRAADEIARIHPHPEPADVLLWAEARAFPS